MPTLNTKDRLVERSKKKHGTVNERNVKRPQLTYAVSHTIAFALKHLGSSDAGLQCAPFLLHNRVSQIKRIVKREWMSVSSCNLTWICFQIRFDTCLAWAHSCGVLVIIVCCKLVTSDSTNNINGKSATIYWNHLEPNDFHPFQIRAYTPDQI